MRKISSKIKKVPAERFTHKQEIFCKLKALGKTNSEAYKVAYDNQDTNPKVVSMKASWLYSQPKIRQRIAELQQDSINEYNWTRRKAILALADIVENDNSQSRIGAVKELNLMHGFDKPEVRDSEESETPVSITIVAKNSRVTTNISNPED